MTTATTDSINEAPAQAENQRQPALPFRGDTLLGVCEAIGQDTGINPTWLRVVFATLLLWNAEFVVISYLALGVVVAVTRWAFPDRKAAAPAQRRAAEPAKAEATVEERKEREELLAA